MFRVNVGELKEAILNGTDPSSAITAVNDPSGSGDTGAAAAGTTGAGGAAATGAAIGG